MKKVVKGIAAYNRQLFLVFSHSPDVGVYSGDTFLHQRDMFVIGLTEPFDIVANDNALFVSEYKNGFIHRLEMPDGPSTKWRVDGKWLKMSVSRAGNILVACGDPSKIMEYTSTGVRVRTTSLDESMNGLGQAIQLENDRFLICHANKSFDRVCIIDNTGNVIKINDRNYSKKVGKLNFPSHLAVDRKGFIVVVDRNNDRIVQLNASLEFIREVIPQSVGLIKPYRMCLNEREGRLYVAELDRKRIFIFDT